MSHTSLNLKVKQFKDVCPEHMNSLRVELERAGKATKRQQKDMLDAINKDDESIESLLLWLVKVVRVPMGSVIREVKVKPGSAQPRPLAAHLQGLVRTKPIKVQQVKV